MAHHELNSDKWTAMASFYDMFKPATSYVAQQVVEAADSARSFSSANYILDIGCGPGAVIEALLDKNAQKIPSTTKLHATDSSDAMIKVVDQLRASKLKQGADIWSRLELSLLDAQNLQAIPENSVSHVTAGLVLFGVPDPRKALREIKGILTNADGGGVLACSSWKQADWMDLALLIGSIRPEKGGLPFPDAWKSPQGVKQELELAGYRDVHAFTVDVTVPFDSYEQVIDFCADKIPHMRSRTSDMTEEEMERLKKLMLDELKRRHPTVPARMNGKNVIAFGRK